MTKQQQTLDSDGKPRRGLDPEIQTLAKLDRLLADLTPAQQARAISWLVSRYAVVTDVPRRED